MPAPNPRSRPRSRQAAISWPAASRIATAILTALSAGSGIGTGSLKKHHDAVARELVERALELANEGPQRAMILAQEVEYLLGLGSLREGGVAAQVAEHDDDLAAMTFM